MEDLHHQHEDPTGEASRRAATYLSLALAAAHRAIESAARRAEQQRAHPVSTAPETGLTRKTGTNGPGDPVGDQLVPTRGDLRGEPETDLVLGDGAGQRAGDPVGDLAASVTTDGPRSRDSRAAAGRGRAAPTGPQISAGGVVAGQPVGSAPALVAHQRYAALIRRVLAAELAEAVLRDKAWPALAAALGAAEHTGADPAVLLQQVAGERELGSAKYPAQVLNLRLTRRTATAADLVASSFPVPVGAAMTTGGQPHLPGVRAQHRAADRAPHQAGRRTPT